MAIAHAYAAEASHVKGFLWQWPMGQWGVLVCQKLFRSRLELATGLSALPTSKTGAEIGADRSLLGSENTIFWSQLSAELRISIPRQGAARGAAQSGELSRRLEIISYSLSLAQCRLFKSAPKSYRPMSTTCTPFENTVFSDRAKCTDSLLARGIGTAHGRRCKDVSYHRLEVGIGLSTAPTIEVWAKICTDRGLHRSEAQSKGCAVTACFVVALRSPLSLA